MRGAVRSTHAAEVHGSIPTGDFVSTGIGRDITWSPNPTPLRSPQFLPHLQPPALLSRHLQEITRPPPGMLAMHLRWRGVLDRTKEGAIKYCRNITRLWTNARREKSPSTRGLTFPLVR